MHELTMPLRKGSEFGTFEEHEAYLRGVNARLSDQIGGIILKEGFKEEGVWSVLGAPLDDGRCVTAKVADSRGLGDIQKIKKLGHGSDRLELYIYANNDSQWGGSACFRLPREALAELRIDFGPPKHGGEVSWINVSDTDLPRMQAQMQYHKMLNLTLAAIQQYGNVIVDPGQVR